jgi:hypothetical protein
LVLNIVSLKVACEKEHFALPLVMRRPSSTIYIPPSEKLRLQSTIISSFSLSRGATAAPNQIPVKERLIFETPVRNPLSLKTEEPTLSKGTIRKPVCLKMITTRLTERDMAALPRSPEMNRAPAGPRVTCTPDSRELTQQFTNKRSPPVLNCETLEVVRARLATKTDELSAAVNEAAKIIEASKPMGSMLRFLI